MDTRVRPAYSSESTVLTIMREGQVRDVNLELTIPTE